MEYHILSASNPKSLTESLKGWVTSTLRWKAQGGICYGLIDNVPAYSLLLARSPKKGVKKHFVPPTLKEVKEYITEKKFGVNADAWYAHYEKVGWLVNKKKMVSWQAAVRTWQYSSLNNKKPLNIPVQLKEFKPENVASKKISQGRIDEIKNMSKAALYKATGQLPMDKVDP